MVLLRFPVFLVVAMSLAACGGGSDSSVGPDLGPLTPGVLEGPVTGLRYETGSESGITDENGAFSYRFGQRVRFYVGDILVGDALGADSLTLFNLAGLDTPPVTATEVRATINQMDASPFATPFETAANLAALLYTLDEDGNASNGIVIPPAIHLLATGSAINFGGRLFSFAGQLPLRKLLHNANSENVWPADRALRNRALAMDALYASLGLVPEIYVNTRADIDHGDDGSIDEVTSSTFDGNGFLNDDHWDRDNNGTIDDGRQLRYDAAGNLVSISEIKNGATTLSSSHFYDSRGFRIRTESTYAAGSGTPDETIHYLNNEYGQILLVSEDRGSDGTIESSTQKEYNIHGQLASFSNDFDNNGTADELTYYGYGGNNQLALVEYDAGGDGTVDATTRLTRNRYGQNLEIIEDSNGDGIDDMSLAYQHNSRQQLIRTAEDFGADGSVETYYYSSYDANGYLVEEKTQVTSSPSYSLITIYARDVLGNVLTRNNDHDGDGTFEETSTYTYNATGNLTESIHDINDNGTIDRRLTYTHQKITHWGRILPHSLN